jgi:hypothetical protein
MNITDRADLLTCRSREVAANSLKTWTRRQLANLPWSQSGRQPAKTSKSAIVGTSSRFSPFHFFIALTTDH